MNSRLIGQVPDARKDRRQEDEMAGWHYRGNAPELGQAALIQILVLSLVKGTFLLGTVFLCRTS